MFSSIKYNVVANFLGRGFIMALSLVAVPFYIRILGTESYGLIGFFSSLQVIISLFDLGIGGTLSRELARSGTIEFEKNEYSPFDTVLTFEIIYWLIGLVVGFLLLISSSYLANSWLNAETLSSGEIHNSLVYMIIAVILQWPTSLYLNGLIGLQRQVSLNIANVLVNSIRIIGGLVAIKYYSPTIETYFVWQIASFSIQAIVFRLLLWRGLKRDFVNTGLAKFEMAVIKKNWKFAVKLSSTAILGICMGQVDKLILSKTLMLSDFGHYMLANTVAQALYLISASISDAMFPKYVKAIASDNKTEANATILHGARLLAITVSSIVITLVLYSSDILLVWTGDQSVVKSINLVSKILLIAVFCNIINNSLDLIQMAYGRIGIVFYKNIIALCFAGPLMAYMSIKYGMFGAALSWLIIYLCMVLVFPVIVFKKIMQDQKMKWYGVWGKILIISIGVAGVVSFFKPADAGKIVNVLFFVLNTVMIAFVNILFIPSVKGIILECWRKIWKMK